MMRRAFAAAMLALAAVAPSAVLAQTTVNAVNDLPCAGSRGSTGCTAGEFTTIVNMVNPSPLDCVANQYVFLSAQLTLSGTNADRFNIGWITGQDGNDPRLTTGSCSVATMPGAPDPPWFLGSQAGNTCGDYRAGVTHTVTINNMKVQCVGDAAGQLQVPYTLIYNQNDTQTPPCTGPVNIQGGSSSKCNAGTAVLPVNTFTVYGAVTITKAVQPSSNAQSFAFTATSADPAQHPVATGDGAFSLANGGSRQVRMRINGTATNLTIAETLVAGWEPSTAITCTRPDGSSAASFVTINNAARTITANLSNANPLANCTITNVKQPTLALTKTSHGAVGGFTFTGNNGWASQTITTATSGTPVTGATQTLSLANTVTTITETIPAGYAVASISCSGLGTGTATPNLATGAVTLNAAAMAPGNNVACTYENNRLPTLTKAFSPTTVAANQDSTLTFTLASPAGSLAQTAVSFTDTFPASLVLAPTPGAATTCTGTPVFTAVAGTGTFTVSGLTVPAGVGSCTVSVAVRSATPATYVNGAAQITASANLINGVTNQSLVVQAAATVAKSFAVANLAAGSSTSLTVTLGNPNAAAITLSSAFTDTFPAGMTIGTAGNTGTCTGVTATAGASSFTVASGTSIPSGGCTVIVNVTSSTAGAALNTIAIGDLQTSAGANTAAANATLNVYVPPTVTKTFTPSAIATGGTSSMVITVTSPAANPGALTGVAINDAYTGTLLNNAAGGVVCSGAGSATLTGGGNGGASVGFSGGTIVAGGTCTITQSVTATSTNANATNAPTATGPVGLTGTAANATLTIFARPTVAKAFGVASLASSGNTSLTVTIGNTNPGAITLTSLFTDTFPGGMTIGTAGNTGTCSGVTALAGAGTFTIANGTSIPSGGCTVIVNVTSSTAGAATNTIAAGQLATSAGTNAAAGSATLDIYAPPTIAKAFGAATLPFGGSTTLTITVTNPAGNPGPVSGLAFTDPLPAGLQVAATPAFSNTCGGTVSPGQAAGDTAITLNGGAALAAGASCQVQVTVTAASAGAKSNTTGAVSATGPVALTGLASNTAVTTVQAAPTLAKAFGAVSLAAGGNTSLTITLGNPNAAAITLTSALTDSLPTGMTIGAAGNTGTCAGVTANAAAGSFTIANGTSIPAGGCTVIVNVTSSTAGAATNTLAAGALQTSAGSNQAAANATLNVYAPPTVTKSFSPMSIASGGSSTLTITVTNPVANPGNLTGVAVNDAYTGTLQNNAVGSIACSGAGSATLTGGANGGTSVGFTAGTLVPGGTCTITQGVTATTTNTNATNAPTATGPVALTGAAATGVVLTVLAPATIAKAFGAASIAASGNTSLTLTLGNTNAGAITLTSVFTDVLPAGMTIGTAGNTGTCTGVTANAAAGSLSIANGTSIPAGGCTVIVNVTSSTAGAALNTVAIGDLQTSAGSNLAAASATLNVFAPPTVTKSFSPTSIATGGSSTLTITVTNPAANPGNLTGVAIDDAYTGTLLNNAAGSVTCSGAGSATLTGGVNGGASVGFSAGTIVPGGTCTITQSVTATTTNTNATNAPTATGPVALTGTAATGVMLTVLARPTVAKAFGVASLASGGNTSLTLTIGNTNPGAITLTAALTDTFPAGMTIGTAGNTGTCTGVTAAAGAGSFIVANGTSIPSGGCTVIVNVTSAAAGAATNTIAAGALQTSANSNLAAASATLDVYAPPTVTKSFSPTSIASGGSATLTITVTNPAANPGNLTGVAIDDAYAGTLLNNAAGSVTCSGAGSATLTGGVNGGASVGFTAGTLVAGGTCTITQSVSATTTNTNATNAPTATGPVALTGTAATGVVLTVQARPTVAKAFGVASLAAGGNTSLTLTLGNTNPGAITLTAALTDTFPAGMTIGTAGNAGTCTGVTATAGTGSFTIANGTSIPSGGCTVIVNVTSSTAGAAVNTIAAGALQTSANSNLAATSATLNVYAPPTVTKSFSPTSIASGGSSTLTITVTSPAANPGNLTGVAIDDAYTGTLLNNAVGSVTCSGAGSATITGGVNGGASVGFSNGTLVPGGTCTITQSVTATTTNTNATNAPTATGPVALTGTAATGVVLTVLAPPTVAKSFGVANLPSGGSTSLTLTIGNANAGAVTLTSLFTDTFPAGMTIGAAGNTGSCTGVTANAAAGNFTIASGTSIPAGGCTVIVTVTSSTPGLATNTIAIGQLTTSAGSNTAAASATVNVFTPPTAAKAFAPTPIASGGTSTLTITLTNTSTSAATLSAALTDTLPTGVTIAATPNAATTCAGAGAVTTTASSVALPAGRAIPAGDGVTPGSCTVSVSVTATLGGSYTNTIAAGALQTSNGNNGAAASAILDVNGVAPTVAKAFAPATIAAGGTSTLTITLTNANNIAASLTAVLTDTLPSGVIVATPSNASSSCTGSGVVTASGSTISLPTTRSIPGGSGAAAGTCTITVDVTASLGGVYANTIAAGALQTSNGSNAAAANASLTVNTVAPTLSKAFAPDPIAAGGTSTLTITLTNANSSAASLTAALTDTLPAGVSIAATPNAATTCTGGGAVTTTAGSVTLPAGRSIPAGSGATPGTCTVTVDATASLGGTYTNTIAAGALATSNGSNAAAASANLTVSPAAPALAKAFSPSPIAAGGLSTLTITLTNANTAAASLSAALIDTLPAGVTIAATPNAATTCTGAGAVSTTTNSVTLNVGRSIPAGSGATPGSCTVTVDVTASLGGTYTNTLAAGALTTSNGSNAAPASANLVVNAQAPTLAKVFAPPTINANDTSTLTLTLANANNTAATLSAALTDTLPAGVSIAATPNASTTCSGAGAVTTTAGSVTLPAGYAIPAGSGATAGTCTVTVDVTAALGGVYTNTVAAGALQTSNGNSPAAATANLTVNTVAPALAKSFAPNTIAPGGVSTLTVTLTNANSSAAALTAALTDTLPAGVSIAAIPNAATTCSGAGAVTITAGSVTLPATRSIPAGVGGTAGSCTVTVDVTSSMGGVYTNTLAAGALTTTAGSNAAPASANLTVTTVGPSVAKAFAPATVNVNQVSTLTITLTNPNTSAATLTAALVDALPGPVVVASTPNATTTCTGSGAVVAAAGSSSITLPSTRSIPAAGSCTVVVDVVSPFGGAFDNTLAIGALQTSNGSNTAAASATLTVNAAAPTIAKAFAPAAIAADGTSTITFTLTNPNAFALTSAAFTDTLSSMSVSGTQANGTCAGASSNTFVNGATGLLNFSGLTIPAAAGATAGSCTVTLVVTSDFPGAHNNQATGVTSAQAPAGAASNVAVLTVTATVPTIAKAFSPASIAVGGTSTITFTIGNTNGVALTAAQFTDTLANMSAMGGAAGGTCAGAAGNNFAAGQTALGVTGLTIPANGSCTVTIQVTSSTPGTHPNQSSGVLSNEAGVSAASNSASLTVTATAPTLAKVFAPNNIASLQIATLTITINNPNAAPITVTSVTDTFPSVGSASLARAPTPNASTTCAGGVVSHTAGSVTLTGGTVPANGSCTFQIDVQPPSAGSYVNTLPAGALTSSAGTNAAAASATLTVTALAGVGVNKLGPASVGTGALVTYSLTITNAGPDAAPGTTFSDVVPGQITGVAASCTGASGGAACGAVNVSGNTVTTTVPALPAGGTVSLTITGTAQGVGSVTNTATVTGPPGVPDPDAGDNSSSVTTAILAPDLTLAKSHVGNFAVGTNGTYTLVVTNQPGSVATTGPITMTDTLPAGLGFVSASGTGWACGFGSGTVTCVHAGALAAGAASNPISLVVSVASIAMPSVTNTATVSGGGEPAATTGNNTASDNTIVVAAAGNAFAPDNTQTGTPGTAVLYPHVFNAGQAGSVAFSTTAVTTPATPGWSQAIYRDTNCNGMLDGAEGNATLTGAVAVLAGQAVCIIVRDTIPVTAPYNSTNNITVSATFNGSQVLTRNDLTIVSGSAGAGLTLSKTVRNVTQNSAAGTFGSARPNDVLEYTITYTNTGAGTLSSIVVTDATPAFTLFQAAACGTLPGAITSCTVTTAPAVNGTGSVSWTLGGSLLSNGSGSVSYTVRVSP